MPGRIKDFIAMPRPNGYQSLHTSVISEHGMPFEVQIRTLEMHRMAEEGVAAHWKYKEGRVGDHKDERYFQWMRQLLEYQQEVRDPQEFIQNLKVELYPEEVYTFTPKGQVKALPARRDADRLRLLDSHRRRSPVRRRARERQDGAAPRPPEERRHRRNHHARPGTNPAATGSTSSSTSHARYKIKHLIRLEERARAHRSRAQGVRKGAAAIRRSAEGLFESEAFAKALSDSGVKTAEDLFALIGYGTLSAKQLLGKLVPADRLREKPPDGAVTAAVKRAFGAGEEKIKVRGSDDVLVFRARCCNPIRGEKIVGYITRGKGVSVHSATCPNVVNLLYDPERRIEVEWDKAPARRSGAPYTVKLTMEVEDRKGVLAAVSAKIADINTNIKNMEARTGRRRSARADRRDRGDQRRSAPRKGDQVAEIGERRD